MGKTATNKDHVIFDQVSLCYGEKVIFENLSFAIPRHSCTLIVGLSGIGKTSILNAITAKMKPIHGSVTVDNCDVASLSDKEIYQYRRDIGMLFQQSGLMPELTVAENVALPYHEHFPEVPEKIVSTAVLLKLEAVGLRGVAHHYPSDLSGGMMRRVALARAVALDPSLILYDEPLTGQDPIACGVLKKLIQGLRDACGATSVIVSHQIHLMADIADYICVLGDKKIVYFGPTQDVFSIDDPYLTQFLNGNPDGVVPFHHPCAPMFDSLASKQE